MIIVNIKIDIVKDNVTDGYIHCIRVCSLPSKTVLKSSATGVECIFLLLLLLFMINILGPNNG